MNSQINQQHIEEAVAILKNGGIIVYPTETIYGIGCDPYNRAACEKIQRLKKRNEDKPLLLLAYSLKQVEQFSGEIRGIPLRLAEVFWPGSLTMVIKPEKDLPPYLYGRSGGVAFRVTPHPVAAALAREFGYPLVSTSANLAGKKPVETYEDALSMFGKTADCILESSIPMHGRPSTVVDLTTQHLAIIREGSISGSRIKEVL